MTDAHDSQTSIRLAEAQYEAASTIYGASQAEQILSAIVVFGGQDFQDAHLALLQPDVQPPQVQIVARRVENSVVRADEYRALSEYPAYDSLAAVEYLYAPELESEPFLMPEERTRLAAQGVEALLVIPLVVAQTLTGLIVFTHPSPIQVPLQVLRAMRNLADQVAVVFENRALLLKTATSLEEVQTLYEVSRALLAAQDPLELLRAIAQILAGDADALTHVTLRRDADGEAAAVRHLIAGGREQVVDMPLPDLRTRGLLTGAVSDVVFVEDVGAVAAADAPALYDMLKDQAGSYVVLIAREGTRFADMIAVTYRRARTFDTRARRLFTNIADQLSIVLQNQRLLREAQFSAEQLTSQVRTLELVNRIARGISSFQSEKALLDSVVREMQEGLGVSHIGVVLIQPDGRMGRVTSEFPDQQSIGTVIDMQENLMIAALLDDPSKPVIVQNVETDPMVPPEVRKFLRAIGTHAIMILPLNVYQNFIGTIGFDIYEAGRTFRPETVELAKTMTSQLAIGLQNIRLFNEAEQRADQTQRIASLGQSLQASLELDPILRVMLAIGVDIIPTDSLTITLYDENSGLLRVVGRYQDGQATIDPVQGTLIGVNDTSAGQVYTTGKMLVIQRGAQTAPGDSQVGSVMIAPLRTRDRRIGTVTIGVARDFVYGETEKAIFQQMVNQLAVALDNSATYARSQRLARSEALVNEITARFQQFSDVDDLVNTAVSELGRALGARRGRVRLATPEDLANQASGQET